jgi:hypothetical protein
MYLNIFLLSHVKILLSGELVCILSFSLDIKEKDLIIANNFSVYDKIYPVYIYIKG